MCDENIEIGVTEITNNILVSATPTDQKIDINVTETTEEVAVNVTPSVVEVNIDVTQELITEIVTIDAETCVNIIDVSVTDASDNVTLNITPSIVEVNINRGGGSGSSEWGSITGTLSDQTDLQSALDAKQNVLGYTPVPSTRTITINGVTYDLSANRSWTVAGGLSGSGTTGYLTKWTGSSALGNSIAYEDAGNFLIGTTSSLYKLTVNTASGVNFGVGKTSLFGTNDAVFLNSVNDSYGSIPFTLNASHIGLYIGYSEKMRINASGNVLIGTTSDITGGGLLQVNGIINSGEYGLLGGYVGLDTTPTTTPSTAGTLSWNDSDGTADLKLKGGNVTLQIGQEEVVRVVNKTGATLNESDFRAVRVRSVSEGGAQGQRLAVVLAQGDSDAHSATTIGLVTESISDNQEGFITTFGNVSEIDTTGAKSWGGAETWVDGDMLYLSPTHAGYLTKVKPVAPQHMVIVGYVVYAHAIHGKIFVKVDNGYELDELHNVAITSPTNGQALVYDSTNSVWKNSTISAGVSGSGTTNYLPLWNGSTSLTNSLISQSGTTITANGLFKANGVIASIDGGLYAGSGYQLVFADYTSPEYAAIEGSSFSGATSYLRFITNALERLRIIANGNVGIGLTNPAYKLDVVGDINITGSYRVNGVVIGAGSGTVTSVSATVPTGFAISGSPITSSGTLAITFATGYSLPTTASQTNWDTAYSNRITSLTTTGSSGASTLVSNVLNIPNYTIAGLGGVPTTRTLTINGVSYDLSADRSWTVSGGGGIIGTGTTNYLTKWTTSLTVGDSLIYDNGTNIGIGTSSPVAKVDITGSDVNRVVLRVANTNVPNGDKEINMFVGGTSAYGISSWQNSGVIESVAGLSSNFVLSNYQVGSIIFTNSGRIERMRILADGRVAIGSTTTIFSSAFQVYQNTAGGVMAHFYDPSANSGFYWSAYSTSILFEARTSSGATYRDMVFQVYGGNFGIRTGVTALSYTLQVNGTVAGVGGYVNWSDARLKKDVKPLENSLNNILNLNGISYNWDRSVDSTLNLDDNNHIGLLAQDVERILPQVVSTAKDKFGTKAIAYSDLVPVLIEAIKELNAKIESK